jgi:hypothetical protein
MREIELKFQVPAEQRAAVDKAVAGPQALRRVRLQAAYFDTPSGALAGAGLALRLRKEGRRWVQTLKGRGDGVMQRVEHELRLPAQRGLPLLDRSRHDGTPAGALLDAALGLDGTLAPLYRTDIQRLHRRVRHQGAVIEIAHDCGRIVAGGHSLPVDEIDERVAQAPGPTQVRRDVAVNAESYRLLTTGLGGGRGALQVARSLAENEQVLAGLRSGILVAGGVVVARQAEVELQAAAAAPPPVHGRLLPRNAWRHWCASSSSFATDRSRVRRNSQSTPPRPRRR